jgi:hypothetical protein
MMTCSRAQIQGPGAFQVLEIGVPEEIAARTGVRKLFTAISLLAPDKTYPLFHKW